MRKIRQGKFTNRFYLYIKRYVLDIWALLTVHSERSKVKLRDDYYENFNTVGNCIWHVPGGGMHFGNIAVCIPFQRNWNDHIIFADAG